ncbi:Protein of unknown function [Gryllus bimaculatus]|nr:Protein of unknown function [Gryllus bimaculatus]
MSRCREKVGSRSVHPIGLRANHYCCKAKWFPGFPRSSWSPLVGDALRRRRPRKGRGRADVEMEKASRDRCGGDGTVGRGGSYGCGDVDRSEVEREVTGRWEGAAAMDVVMVMQDGCESTAVKMKTASHFPEGHNNYAAPPQRLPASAGPQVAELKRRERRTMKTRGDQP